MDCFVISPIGSEGSDVRIEADQLYDFVIKPALEPLGYKISRADKIDESGLITSQIVERIVSVDLVVAVLTHQNANVFYELAIRHLIGKPFIHMMHSSQDIPFDVTGSRTILYSLDLSGARKAESELAQQAKVFVEDPSKQVESPISVAIDLKALHSSEDPVSTALSRIERDLSGIRSDLDSYISQNGMDIGRGVINALRHNELYSNDNEANALNAFAGGAPSRRSLPEQWTDERVETLKSMWEQGNSASQIAKELGGLSRNAVLGKIHRLGLYTKKSDE